MTCPGKIDQLQGARPPPCLRGEIFYSVEAVRIIAGWGRRYCGPGSTAASILITSAGGNQILKPADRRLPHAASGLTRSPQLT